MPGSRKDKKHTQVKSVCVRSTRKRSRESDQHSLTPSNKSKQKKSRSENRSTRAKSKSPKSRKAALPKMQKTAVKFTEDDEVVEMEAEGENTEFQSNNEQEVHQGHEDSSSDEDDEVTFSFQNTRGSQENNNATRVSEEEEKEDGECSPSGSQPRPCSSSDTTTSVIDTERMIEEKVNQSLNRVQDFYDKKFADLSRVYDLEKQLAENKRKLEILKARGRKGTEIDLEILDNVSELTIYRNAVEKKRGSSSSEDDGIDTSDKHMDLGNVLNPDVSVVERELERNRGQAAEETDRASGSGIPANVIRSVKSPEQRGFVPPKRMLAAKDAAEEISSRMLREAEDSAARVYDVPGNNLENYVDNQLTEMRREVQVGGIPHTELSCLIDEDYMLVANHLDETLKAKIIANQYVDFSKLLNRDRSEDENQKMTLVNRGGLSYWIPLEKSNSIGNYVKWEQAFRVFLHVYSSKFPTKATELIQYNHTIQTAANSYSWDNVYQYDKEFRRHIERHPTRKWSIILQQAWTMFLKDRVNATPSKNGNSSQNGSEGGKPKTSRRLCYDFNDGNCRFGNKCRFEHKCGFCGKYGHGTINCRKAQAVRDKKAEKMSNPTNKH